VRLLHRLKSPTAALSLASPPTTFFMTLRDVGLWVRSAHADGRLNRYRDSQSTGVAFDRLYDDVADPFGSELPQFRYQQRKYQMLLSMLPKRRYRQALDIGCGLGTFTRKLAPFVDHVLGTDISAEALRQARRLSSACPNITYAQSDLADSIDKACLCDLVILADTMYYIDALTDERLNSIAAAIAKKLAPGGLLLVVNHYFFGIDSASKSTRRIHDAFRREPSLDSVAEQRRAFFLATLLRA
jgi:predicted TPR repeat methyltransferase